MRGRTNITQRALPYVNGDVITAEVETGNTIAVGDFVEHKLVSAITDADFSGWTSGTAGRYNKEQLYLNDYKINLRSNTLEIWDRNTQRIAYTYSTSYVINSFVILSNGGIITVEKTSNSLNTPLVINYFKFENNELTLLDTLTITVGEINSNLSNVTYITGLKLCQLDSTHICLIIGGRRYVSSSDQYNKTNYAVFSFTNLGELTFVNNSELSVFNSSVNERYSQIETLDIGNNTFIQLSVIDDSSSSYSTLGKVKRHRFAFDNQYNITVSDVGDVSSNLQTLPLIKISESSIVIGGVNYTNIFIFNYDSNLDSVSLIDTGLNLRFSVSDSPFTMMSYSETNVFFGLVIGVKGGKRYGNFYRIEFDEENKTIKYYNYQAGTYETGLSIYIRQMIYKLSDKIHGYSMEYENKKISFLYSSSDNVLELPEDTRYVKSYNSGKAIGFAKTAGNSGESIKVYVPHQS